MKTLPIPKRACKHIHFVAKFLRVLIPNRMTIGWIEEFVRDGEVVDGFKAC
jgi:hypothetical protein